MISGARARLGAGELGVEKRLQAQNISPTPGVFTAIHWPGAAGSIRIEPSGEWIDIVYR